jgi:hypothetical protein
MRNKQSSTSFGFLGIILSIFIVLTYSSSFCQSVIRSSGTSQVRVESSMTKEDARDMAEELAMINAIENEFNTYVEQEGETRIQNGRVNFDIIGNTKVRGEWVRTIKKKFTEETSIENGDYGKEQVIWIKCDISGEIRECASRANLEVSTLNCPKEECRTTGYFNSGNLYLHFTSPVDGYLSIYLADNEKVYRLLPYVSMGTINAVQVDGDEDYIIFSHDHSYPFNTGYKIDALELSTNRAYEYNSIYVIFSEDEYVKPILENVEKLEDGYYLPRSLEISAFKEWLGDCRADMEDFQAQRIRISIEK